VADALRRAHAALDALSDADFATDVLEARCRTAAEDHGWKAGDFFRPIRMAVTGRAVSPPLFGSMELLGRSRTLARLEIAAGRLSMDGGAAA
jgi:glutamyl-tRNA synthetase